jgi:hypothetical protein
MTFYVLYKLLHKVTTKYSLYYNKNAGTIKHSFYDTSWFDGDVKMIFRVQFITQLCLKWRLSKYFRFKVLIFIIFQIYAKWSKFPFSDKILIIKIFFFSSKKLHKMKLEKPALQLILFT